MEFSSKSSVADRAIQAILYVLANSPGLKKTQLAIELGTKQPKLSEILNGKVFPNSEIMSNLCKKYSISGNWILFGEEPMVNVKNGTSVKEEISTQPFPDKTEILDRLETILKKDNSSVEDYEKEHRLFPGTFNNARKRGNMRIVSDWVYAILREHPNYSFDWVYYGEGDCLRKHQQPIQEANNPSEDTNAYLRLIAEKDAIIEKKDSVILQKDETITKLAERIADITKYNS